MQQNPKCKAPEAPEALRVLGVAYNMYYESDRVVQMADGTYKVPETFTDDEWSKWLIWRIKSDSPKERLGKYLGSIGVYGYTDTIFAITAANFKQGDE